MFRKFFAPQEICNLDDITANFISRIVNVKIHVKIHNSSKCPLLSLKFSRKDYYDSSRGIRIWFSFCRISFFSLLAQRINQRVLRCSLILNFLNQFLLFSDMRVCDWKQLKIPESLLLAATVASETFLVIYCNQRAATAWPDTRDTR